MRLVDEVHKTVRAVVKQGDLGIDATIGNGYDTEFLVKLGVKVIGFDIQHEAIVKTEKRLKDGGNWKNVILYNIGHERMLEFIAKDWTEQVQIVMFNLGYLPGGDKRYITRPETTLKALVSAYSLLKEGGYMSVMVYPDHEGGEAEARMVESWTLEIEGSVSYLRPGASGPLWYWVRKLGFNYK